EAHAFVRPLVFRALLLRGREPLRIGVLLEVAGTDLLLERATTGILPVLGGDARLLVLLEVLDDERLAAEDALLGLGETVALPLGQLDVTLDHDELVEGVGEISGGFLERGEVGQLELAKHGLPVAWEVTDHDV